MGEIKEFIKYNGVTSKEMNLRLLNDVVHTSASARIDFQEVDGLDGEIAIDRESLSNVKRSYPFSFYGLQNINVEQQSSLISNWLLNDIGWHDLELSWDETYLYRAIYHETFNPEETLRKVGKVALNFTIKPIKRRKSSLNPVVVNNEDILANPEKRIAKPLIKITGVGDITLKNNGNNWAVLSGVDGELFIDSQTQSVYKGITPYFDKMNSSLSPLFPVLYSGNNKITWTGNVTKLEITPRWEAVV